MFIRMTCSCFMNTGEMVNESTCFHSYKKDPISGLGKSEKTVPNKFLKCKTALTWMQV